MKEYFPVEKIRFEGADSRNPLAFKIYDPDAIVAGKTMREHMRFAVAYWHTFKAAGNDPFGDITMDRPWNAKSDPLERAEDTMRACFEFCQKLDVDYYCFHDYDVAPEGATLAEGHSNVDRIAKLAGQLQSDTGIKLLWNTSNLFSNPRFMAGAATSPHADVFAYAAAKVKKMLEVGKELGAENYVFWGGREGYETLLNTDMKRELDHLAAFLGMAVDYAKQIGFDAQFLIEPKPKEPTKHQYDFDAGTVIGFLKTYGLSDHFKLNIEANHATLATHSFQHDLLVSSINGMLGSVDANRGDELLGWDTDQFPTSVYETTYAMLVILGQGGLGTGGLNFDAKVRRPSNSLDDLFHAHIGAMDAFAHGLKTASRIIEDGALSSVISERYSSYDSGIGQKIEAGTTNFEELEAHALSAPEPVAASGRQELLENTINQYILG